MAKLYDVSIVCVYNNDVQYKALADSLMGQAVSCELLGLDNKNFRWKSAAAAYKYGVSLAQAPVVLFSHQDIVFLDDSFLREFVGLTMGDPELVVGVAGAALSEDGRSRDLLSGMYQGNALRRHKTVQDRVQVMTLDECLFGCNKRVFERITFDDSTCDGWHFYAVDFSLQALRAGLRVEVVPAEVLHLSGGTRDDSYYLAQEKLKQKYAGVFEVIATTCGWTRTSDIDPYRPIVSDELRTLRAYDIPYVLNFYHKVSESLSIESEDFFPILEDISVSQGVRCADCDMTLFDEVRSAPLGASAASLEIIVALNNALKLKRWLMRDLLSLKGEEIEAVRLEYELSMSYRLGSRFLPWTRVDAIKVMESCKNDERVFSESKFACGFEGSPGQIAGYIDDCLLGDPDDLLGLVKHVCSQVLKCQEASPAAATCVLARSSAERMLVNGLDEVCEIVKMQHALNRIDRSTSELRRAYERSGAYRLGRAAAKLREVSF